MEDLRVVVHRYTKSGKSEIHDGFFRSKVYAIDGNKFLVYDNGEDCSWDIPEHFEWVDFTVKYVDIDTRFIVELDD